MWLTIVDEFWERRVLENNAIFSVSKKKTEENETIEKGEEERLACRGFGIVIAQ